MSSAPRQVRPAAPRKLGASEDRRLKYAPSDLCLLVSVFVISAIISSTVLYQVGVLGNGDWLGKDAVNIQVVNGREQWDALRSTHNKPALLAFYSKSCPACKRMRKPFRTVAALPRMQNVLFVVSDVGTAHNFADAYGIQFVPTLMFFPSGSDAHVTYTGTSSATSLVKFLDEQLKQTRQ